MKLEIIEIINDEEKITTIETDNLSHKKLLDILIQQARIFNTIPMADIKNLELLRQVVWRRMRRNRRKK